MSAPRIPIEQRLWPRVDKSGDCWIWQGALTTWGYGTIRYKGRPCQAHRVAYELLVGPIPDGMQLDHICRVRACVNPAHLEPVTNRENVLRGFGITANHAGKTHCIHGHPFDEANTYHIKNGHRQCRTCTRDRMRARRAKAHV